MMLKSSFCICLLVIASVSIKAKDWRGIVPLHSSKQDVERLLGPPKRQAKHVNSYEFAEEFVDVYFATGPPCGVGLTDSWSVPPETVVGITVTTKRPLPFDSVVSDTSRYVKSVDSKDVRRVYYFDEEQGVRYTVRADDQSSQDVMSVDYLPSKEDDRLKCSSPTPKAGPLSLPPFEQYGRVSIAKRNAILDNFAIQLELDGQLRGLIYARGGRIGFDDAREAANDAHNYLINIRKVQADRIVTMTEAGCDELMVELYLLPKGAHLP